MLARFHKDRRGAAATEFAVVGATLFAFLFGVIEVGRMAFSQHVLDMALRHAGRAAIVRSSDSANPIDTAGVETLVRQAAGLLDDGALAVTVTYSSGNTVGNPLLIDATYQFDVTAAFVPLGSITLSATYTGTIIN